MLLFYVHRALALESITPPYQTYFFCLVQLVALLQPCRTLDFCPCKKNKKLIQCSLQNTFIFHTYLLFFFFWRPPLTSLYSPQLNVLWKRNKSVKNKMWIQLQREATNHTLRVLSIIQSLSWCTEELQYHRLHCGERFKVGSEPFVCGGDFRTWGHVELHQYGPHNARAVESDSYAQE